MTKVFEASADVVGEKIAIDHQAEHIFAIAADADLGGGTLSLKVYDHASNTELSVAADEYTFTDVFTPFKVLLAPGMSVEVSLAGATDPDISGVFMYFAET